MVIKCKTVSKLAAKAAARGKDAVVEEEETEGQIVAVDEVKNLSDEELVEARTKELKSMGAADLKELMLSHGLATGTKEVMIKALLKHEAKARAAAEQEKAKIREVVVQKKQELEALSTAELSKQCDSIGFKARSKWERVQRLLVHWQENDGVDKALAKIAENQRKQDLEHMDDSKLEKLCTKMGVDPYVKEVMVERLSKKEHDAGLYSRPKAVQEEAPKEDKKVDMVEAMLANEAQRKKEKEVRIQQEDALAQKRKDLKALSIDDLKKKLAKKKLEASGKKEDMIEVLFLAMVQEDAVTARKAELKTKSQPELKELLARNGLETGGKDQMINTLLAHEAKCREDLKAFDMKVEEIAEQKKEELDDKTNAALKEMCATKGLAVGGDKEERIDRLIEEVKKEGGLDKTVSTSIRNKRKEELMAMDKQAIVKLCEKNDVNPVVREIMVERIMMHESEADAGMAGGEPAAKRRRK